MHSIRTKNAHFPSPAGSDSGGCDAHLTCARPLASKTGGTTDIKCTVGSCCASHGVPLKGGFLSGETHEQFAHYVALLAVLVPLIPGVLAVLLDINCQFGKHLRANYPTIAAGLKFYIGWLHARAGHNISCQLEYSAVFQGGLGRCVGELIEQLWVRDACPPPHPRFPLVLLPFHIFELLPLASPFSSLSLTPPSLPATGLL